MSDIVEFLEARIAEDEARAGSGWSRLGDSRWETTNEGQDFLTPSAVLDECAAKRAIIELHAPIKDEGWVSGKDHGYLWCGSCGSIDDSPEPYPCDTLKAIAAVYKDHPDYQQEWTT